MSVFPAGSATSRLAAEGVVGVALSFIDTSGIARVKTIPLAGLPAAAESGIGAPPSFDVLLPDNTLARGSSMATPDGDLRLIPDLTALRLIPGQPGWAWAPVDRYFQNGTAYPACHRLFLADMVRQTAVQGLRALASIDVEFRLFAESDSEAGYEPVSSAPGYSMAALLDIADFASDLMNELEDAGLTVAQFHPEAAPGQYELSLEPSDPMAAADNSVLVRLGIRTVAAAHGMAASFSPVPKADEAGNGGHVHLSLWDGDGNVFTGGSGRFGMRETGEQFLEGVISTLPALTALFNPAPVSYLRMRPSQWAGVFSTWGLEAREAAIRFVADPTSENGHVASIEVKPPDLAASPYLAIGALLAAGLDGIGRSTVLRAPVQGDPASLSEEERVASGIVRLPETLDQATDALRVSHLLQHALGSTLFDAVVAVRRAESARSRRQSPDDLIAAARWLY